jgi:hypothetical protein
MHVEIWSDVVCPWCHVGKRRFAHRDGVNVVWRSFELDPAAPRRHVGTLDDLMARKIGATPAHETATAVAGPGQARIFIAAGRPPLGVTEGVCPGAAGMLGSAGGPWARRVGTGLQIPRGRSA